MLPPPEHIAIIMDGNGRWANQRGLPRIEGHRRGVENVRKVVEEAGKLGIRYLTLFAFSAENWRRPSDEVNALMDILRRNLGQFSDEFAKHEVSLRTIGRTSELPAKVQEAIAAAEAKTSHGAKGTLILALNYGSRQEILDGARRYAEAARTGDEDPSSLSWETFRRHLYTAEWPDPDLLIRTSGESRLSNFLLLQCAYAELVFRPELWPDFGAESLREAVEEYQRRQRRFGLTGEQVVEAATAPS